ncbi:MAG: type II secretion system F family protein [Methanocellales archaeon]|nr:type II secretion system F family protein [Methanocellales archaeon]
MNFNLVKKIKAIPTENPLYAMILSIPAAIIFLLSGLHAYWNTPLVDDVVIFTVLIAVTPPGFAQYYRYVRIGRIEECFPDFIRDLAEIKRSGTMLPRGLRAVAKGEYGALTPEIKKMDAMVSWGIPFEEALKDFAKRVKTPLVTRTVSLIIQAERAGANVPDILEVAAKDAREIKALEDERRGSMAIYVAICYLASFVFLFVIMILSAFFLPVMSEAGASIGGAGGIFLREFDPMVYTRLFFHTAIIQAFASGLVAGQMGEGEITAGLKHSVILILIVYGAFVFMQYV